MVSAGDTGISLHIWAPWYFGGGEGTPDQLKLIVPRSAQIFISGEGGFREGNVFTNVCHSVRGGDLCMMSLPIWWTGPMFFGGGLRAWSHVPSGLALDPGVFHPGGGGGPAQRWERQPIILAIFPKTAWKRKNKKGESQSTKSFCHFAINLTNMFNYKILHKNNKTQNFDQKCYYLKHFFFQITNIW